MIKKLDLANLPTKISKLERFSSIIGTEIYIKRDDYTGIEWSGNKVRKLEFAVAEAISQGCDSLITCGGIQSNHCRATIAVAASIGLKSAVLLRISEQPELEGNYFLDKLLGAEIEFCSKLEYANSRMDIMNKMADEHRKKGLKPYIIPEGASYGIGCLGYYNAMLEILEQEKQMQLKFDTIIVATGSGATHGGLYLANKLMGLGKRIIGYAVCDDKEYFKNCEYNMLLDAIPYLEKFGFEYNSENTAINKSEIEINDDFVGIGYAQSRQEELDFIIKFAIMEGIILDPVYTGKAMYGIFSNKEESAKMGRVLFIHTGGIFGVLPKVLGV